MSLRLYTLKVYLTFIFCSFSLVFSNAHQIQGQLSGWLIANHGNDWNPVLGLRYIPKLDGYLFQFKAIHTDYEISLNSYGTAYLSLWDSIGTKGQIDLYRTWFRFFTDQFEARVGLQKINFGSATCLRPLMWFDQIDPQDPLQITDGVYGLLLKYYFLNNANIWCWGLYGNNKTKGWEFLPTKEKTIEWGGRIQHPVPRGEIAISYHQRQADVEKGVPQLIQLAGLDESYSEMASNLFDLKSSVERRIGIDGKWDMTVGLWSEAVFIHRDIDWLPYPYQRMITVGTDYTFSLGNGVHCLYEHFWFEISEKIFGTGEGMTFSAFSVNYPLGLLDNLTGMVYRDWENKEWYRFINWQRTTDRFSFHLIGFWNPDQFQIYQNLTEANVFSGKGFQIMVVFNH